MLDDVQHETMTMTATVPCAPPSHRVTQATTGAKFVVSPHVSKCADGMCEAGRPALHLARRDLALLRADFLGAGQLLRKRAAGQHLEHGPRVHNGERTRFLLCMLVNSCFQMLLTGYATIIQIPWILTGHPLI